MFNSKALELARKCKGYTKKELAKILNLSQQTLSEWETKKVIPKTENIIEMAGVLGFPLEFFYVENSNIPDSISMSFRALSKMKAKDRDIAESSGKLAITLNNWIETRFNLPVVNIPNFTNCAPEECAQKLRSLWNINDSINNTIYLLESHGIRVYSLIQSCHDFDALSTWYNNTPFIFLNTTKSAERCRFDAMHELGHLIMHKNLQPNKNQEEEANKFAAEMLMPKISVMQYQNIYPSLENFIELKKIWNVSLKAIVYRYHKLNLISDWNNRALNIEMRKRNFDIEEPQSIERETSIVLSKIIKMLIEDNCTIQDISYNTKIPVDYINKLMFNAFSMELIIGGQTHKGKSKANLRII